MQWYTLFTVVKLMFTQYYPTIHVRISLLIPLLIKTHDSESRGQEEAAVRDE